ncbi:MAG: hypothetical protein AAFV33_15360, partial [Chloroflexota bacterium]
MSFVRTLTVLLVVVATATVFAQDDAIDTPGESSFRGGAANSGVYDSVAVAAEPAVRWQFETRRPV